MKHRSIRWIACASALIFIMGLALVAYQAWLITHQLFLRYPGTHRQAPL